MYALGLSDQPLHLETNKGNNLYAWWMIMGWRIMDYTEILEIHAYAQNNI